MASEITEGEAGGEWYETLKTPGRFELPSHQHEMPGVRAAQVCLGGVCVSCHSPPALLSVISLAIHPLMMAARLVLAVVIVFWVGDSVGQLRRDEWDTWSPSCSW